MMKKHVLSDEVKTRLAEYRKGLCEKYFGITAINEKKYKGTDEYDDGGNGDDDDNGHSEQLEVLKQGDDAPEALDEAVKKKKRSNVIKIGRVKLIRARIRKGKIQRRKKLSAVKGFRLKAGKLKRMTAGEKRKRKLGARRAKFKRKAKRSRIKVALRRSLRRRKAMGL
jgi:hypothetical protein